MGPKIFQHLDFRRRYQEEGKRAATAMKRNLERAVSLKKAKAKGSDHLYHMLLGDRRIRTEN